MRYSPSPSNIHLPAPSIPSFVKETLSTTVENTSESFPFHLQLQLNNDSSAILRRKPWLPLSIKRRLGLLHQMVHKNRDHQSTPKRTRIKSKKIYHSISKPLTNKSQVISPGPSQTVNGSIRLQLQIISGNRKSSASLWTGQYNVREESKSFTARAIKLVSFFSQQITDFHT